MNKEIAHFFWHGELSKFEYGCILSFVKAGFDVNVWSYTNIKVEGVTSRNAAELLDESLLYKIFHHFNERTSEHSSLAAFSDLFRFKVLSAYGGWWFDTDCICIRSSDQFKLLRGDKNLIVGLEDKNRLAVNSVIYSNKEIASKLFKKAESLVIDKNYALSYWGEIGPVFISQFALDENLFDSMLPTHNFFQIANDQHRVFIENDINYAMQILKHSYVTHVWTSRWKEFGINKNNLPTNSVVYYLLNQTDIIEKEPALLEPTSIAHFNRLKQIDAIYRSVLKRAPDYNGLVSYCKNNMSIGEIMQDIKNSIEAKNILK
jgi:hypothetical protein